MTPSLDPLSRRERQVMDLVYRHERVSVADVREHMSEPPSYSAVRALMRTLVEKGHLSHTHEGRKYVYSPTVSPDRARRSALSRVVENFFAGSPVDAAVALVSESPLDEDALHELERAIARARAEGR